MRIDLNCDMGEGTGDDALIMPYISSVNIACGGHAGDDASMRATVALAARHGVAIGAHPSFEDRENFGRRELTISPEEIRASVATQIRRLQQITWLRHVKPHGALYNLAARNADIAGAIARAVVDSDPELILVGLAGSQLLAAGRAARLRVASEAFIDRAYRADGTLLPRTEPGAVFNDELQALRQTLDLVRLGQVKCGDGGTVAVEVDTLCVHSDTPGAASFVRKVRQALVAAGVRIESL